MAVTSACKTISPVACRAPLSYHSGMKYAVSLCVLMLAVAAQAAPSDTTSSKTSPRIQTGSRVPSLTIKRDGDKQRNGDYFFVIQNNSGHGVTAFDVLLVSKGVPKKKRHYDCRGRCSSTAQVGDIESPVIAAGKRAIESASCK